MPASTAVTPPEVSRTGPGRPAGRRVWWLVAAASAVGLTVAAGAVSFAMRQGPEWLRAPHVAARAVPPAPATAPASAPASAAASAPSATPSTAGAAGVPCRYETAPGTDTTPRPPTTATRSGPVRVTLRTSLGSIELTLDATAAPCGVNSFVHLAGAGFYTDSPCHRLTTAAIFVLQCGDPTATGSGGPGYRFNDENLPVNTMPAYPRGTVAMANAGPDTNGSQFFLVYRDSDIAPNYPVLGRVTAGLDVVDRVAAGGAPGDDGPPEVEIVIEAAEA